MRRSLTLAILPLALAETLVWAALYYVFPALLPVWEQDFGWSRDEVAGAFTASLIVMALAAPRAGRLIDQGREKVMFLGMMVLGAVLLASLAWVTELWQFWAIWIAIGLVNACILYEACFAIITVVLGARARAGITVVTLVAGFAGTVCFPAYFWLTEAYGWRVAVQAFAAVTVFVSVPLAWWGLSALEHHRQPPADKPLATGGEGRAVLRKPAFWGLAIGFASVGLVHGMLISHIRPILGDAGLAAATAILVASLMGPMQVVGRVVIVTLQHRIDTYGTGVAAFVGMGAGLLLLMAAGAAPWLAIVFVLPYGACWGMMSIVRPVLTAEFLGRAGFGVISGMIAVPFVLGSAAGPLASAWLWEIAGYDLVLELSLGLALFGMLSVIVAKRTA